MMQRVYTILGGGVLGGLLVSLAFAQFNQLPFEAPVRYVASLPATGAFPGQEIRVVAGNPPSVTPYVWNASSQAFEQKQAGDLQITDDLTVDDDALVTGDLTVSGDSTLGSDEDDTITANGPIVRRVMREDFDLNFAMVLPGTNAVDFTAVDVADTERNNLLLFSGGGIGIINWRYELAYGGTWAAPFDNGRFMFTSAGFVDAAANDGLEMTFGGSPLATGANGAAGSAFFDEDQDVSAYCEISLFTGDVSDFGGTTFFGAVLLADYQDTVGFNAYDTYAVFTISDTSGDLDIETELNGGGTLNDDVGVALGDNATEIWRVEMQPDAVVFYRNGTAITQTNAVLNADAGDRFRCGLGFVLPGAASPDAYLEYVEIGRAQ